MIRGLVLELALVACAQGAELDSPEQLVFSPDEALELSTMVAAERWSAAGGMDVHVGEGGVRIEAADRVFQPSSGEEVCAHAYRSEGRIVVATRPHVWCPSVAVLVTHEMGHVLARRGGHAENGVMRDGREWTAADYPITEASLALICERAHCTVFAPESPEVTAANGEATLTWACAASSCTAILPRFNREPKVVP